MAQLVLNPNSIYKNSQANFILNKDALYAFTRSISSLNESMYGMQPTKEQLLSGFSISDVFDVNPLSSNGSLCASVYVMEENIGALKFFAARPFVVCEDEEDRDQKAQNPLAVYLTPLSSEEQELEEESSNDSCEWIYVLSPVEGVSDWDVVVSAYTEWQLSGDEFHLTSFPGKWEMIGTTSFTDEKISLLFKAVNDNIQAIEDALSGVISSNVSALISALSDETAARTSADSELNSKIEDEISNSRQYSDEALISAKSYADQISSALCGTVSVEIERASGVEADIKNSYLPLSGSKTIESYITISDYVEIAKDGVQTAYKPLAISILSSNEIEGEESAVVAGALKFPEDELDSAEKTIATREWTAQQIEDLDLPNVLSSLFSAAIVKANSYTDDEISALELDSKLTALCSTVCADLSLLISAETQRATEVEDKISYDLSSLSSSYERTEESLSDYVKTSAFEEVVEDLSNYVLKTDLKEKIESELSGFSKYVDGEEPYPKSISAMVEWSAAIHRALSAIASL